MNKVSIITLGCKQNKYESDCMAEILSRKGYEVIDTLEYADIYVLNTCAVTNEAEKKSRQHIMKFNKLNPNAKIIVCGCASENNLEQFKNKENVFAIIGTENKQSILDLIDNAIMQKYPIPLEYNSPVLPQKTTTREYLKIQDGCNNFCSYCIIPYLRGRSRSRALEDILSEARILSQRSKEIVLTGIDISDYRINGKKALPILMQELSSIPALIRLGSLEVGVINIELLETLRSMPNFAPHFHLSLQSGDDSVLKRMNRHYSAQEFYDKTRLILQYFPNANLTTDVIVGFAGETEEEFINTRDFIEKVGFSFVHIFPYSRRDGTLSSKLYKDLPSVIKKERVDRLEEVNARLKENYLNKFIGKSSRMLVEEKKEYWEGFSPEYIRCYYNGNVASGDLINIKFVKRYKDGLIVEKI